MPAKIIDFLRKYEAKIVLILGFLLISGLSFEAGLLEGRKTPSDQLIIEKPGENCPMANLTPQDASEGQKSTPEALKTETGTNTLPQNCAFLGSKNSNKYHLPTCRWAKSIKPENRVCFSSENEAQSRGYLPDKNCIK